MTAHDATSPHQFGKYMMTKENWDQGGSTRWTTHRLYKQGADQQAPAEHVGTMDIKHSAPEVYNLYPGPMGLTTPSSDSREMLHRGYNEKWASQQAEAGGQIPMFKHSSDRARTEVDTLIMTEADRHMATTMVGTAANVATEHGHHLQTPDSLSKHSERMVGKLKEHGAVQEGHTFSPNNLDWAKSSPVSAPGGLAGLHSALGRGDFKGESAVPVPEVRRGQRTARQVLGTKRRSAAFEQGTLF